MASRNTEKMRLKRWVDQIRSNFWLVPGVLAAGAVILNILLVVIDAKMDIQGTRLFGWLAVIGPDGARLVMSTLAGSTITVASVIFSITVVAMNMTTAQFGPGLLQRFFKSGETQVAMGVFISCFIYSLLTLLQIPDDRDVAPVPFISVATGVVFGIVSFLVLLWFIHHTSRLLQASRIIEEAGHEAVATFDRVLKRRDDDSVDDESAYGADFEQPVHGKIIRAKASGYIQTMNYKSLLKAAIEHDTLIRIDIKVGQHIIEGQPIGCADVPDDRTEAIATAIGDALALGRERTPAQDPEFAIEELVEIALRSLSPGINAPLTAANVVDELAHVFSSLAGHRLPSSVLRDEGRPRVILQRYTYDGVLDAAFNPIRQNALDQPLVQIRLMETMVKLAQLDAPADFRRALARHAAAVYTTFRDKFAHPDDQEALQRRYNDFQQIQS